MHQSEPLTMSSNAAFLTRLFQKFLKGERYHYEYIDWEST